MFKSIRSRLSLSFAGIALVGAVVLGAVLLAILQNYYSNLELEYLRGNAEAVGSMVAVMAAKNASHAELQSQVENLAFLSQTRVQVDSPDGEQLYDSGSPQNLDVKLGAMPQTLVQTNGPVPDNAPGLPLVVTGNGGVPSSGTPISPGPGMGATRQANGQDFYFTVQAGGSPFGFVLNAPAASAEVERSSLSVTERVRDPVSARELGSVRLSDGPAYGRDILSSVARGWLLASGISVLLAAAIGWYLSRRISAPVLALKDVTARMVQGDLSSRADVEGRDEFGQLARSFNEMADQVETTVITLRRFVSDAAHELRTPLAALRADLDLALEKRNATRYTALVSRAQAAVRRIEALNSNLLDLSRLEAGGPAAKEAVVDLAELLRSHVELHASQAEQAGLAFEAQVPSAPVLIRADASQITRAMDNLVDNACKFTPQDGTIRVALSEEAGQAIFSVADTGIGIPADELPQLFQRFHRGRNASAYPGSGLGLAIVKAIASTQGGRVEVQSAGEGKGSRFSLRLPVVRPSDSPEAARKKL